MTTAQIPLTQGQFAIVDAEDLELLSQWKWCAHRKANTTYAVRTVYADGAWKTVHMHTVITGYVYVDHKNGNGLDNRRANLREATALSNNHNRRPNRGCAYKGITPVKDRWRARILLDGRRVSLGTFSAPEDAARAYDRAAYEQDPEFCYLNFPDEYRG